MRYTLFVVRTETTLKETHEAQRLLGRLEYDLRNLRDELAWELRESLNFTY